MRRVFSSPSDPVVQQHVRTLLDRYCDPLDGSDAADGLSLSELAIQMVQPKVEDGPTDPLVTACRDKFEIAKRFVGVAEAITQLFQDVNFFTTPVVKDASSGGIDGPSRKKVKQEKGTNRMDVALAARDYLYEIADVKIQLKKHAVAGSNSDEHNRRSRLWTAPLAAPVLFVPVRNGLLLPPQAFADLKELEAKNKTARDERGIGKGIFRTNTSNISCAAVSNCHQYRCVM